MAVELVGGHSMFRVPAEERGYGIELLDEMGDVAAESGRPVAGGVVTNDSGDALYVPREDFAAIGDLFIRQHVRAGRP
jgi:hypothetical protein